MGKKLGEWQVQQIVVRSEYFPLRTYMEESDTLSQTWQKKERLLSEKFSEPSTGTRVSMRVTEKRMCGM